MTHDCPVSGLHIERLEPGPVVVFTLSDMKRATVDAWIDACLAEMRACVADGRPLRVVQDLSHPAAIHRTQPHRYRQRDVLFNRAEAMRWVRL